MPLKTVFNTFNPAEAQLIRSMLEAAGVQATVTHELAALTLEGYAMAAGGIKVQVLEEDVSRARELIEELPEKPDESD